MEKMQLNTYASFVLNRTVTKKDAARAAGYKSERTFSALDRAGELPLDRIVAACQTWGISANDSLVALGYLTTPDDAVPANADDETPDQAHALAVRRRVRQAATQRVGRRRVNPDIIV